MSEKNRTGAKVYNTEKEQVKGLGVKQKDARMDMREMAARNVRHQLEPMPMTHPPDIDPFPAPVMRGLWLGALGGLLVGLVWAALQINGILAVPGWEGLFSMTPVTFYTFWAVIGAALFGMIFGIAAIIAFPVDGHPSEKDVRK